MSKITVARWDEREFMASEVQWTSLLATSDADRLFLSWDWQSLWWQIFGPEHGLELLLLAARDEDGELVGIAPLFIRRIRKARLFNIVSAQFIGNIWPGPGTVRTEYLDFIVKGGMKKAVMAAFADYLMKEIKWDELVLTDLDTSLATHEMLCGSELFPRCARRFPEQFKSFYVDTAGDFNDYLAGLGAKTRLKLYNRRKYLEALGEVTLDYANAENVGHFFEVLNNLHRARWNKELYTGSRLEFHHKLTQRLAREGGINFCLLSVSGTPQSALYNIRIGDHDYGIQSGFNDHFDKKVSLGALHYGYLIESAFHSNIKTFDFLAGDGKMTDYKNHYTTTYRALGTVQIIRNRLLSMAYKGRDAWK